MGWFENAIKFPVVFLALVTALLSGTGLIIINGHLGTYFISDYTIISTRSIYTGIIFFLFLSVSVVIMFSGVDVHNMNKINYKNDVFNFITKPIICTNVFLTWFAFVGNTPDLYPTYSIFGLYNINSYWVYGPVMSSFFALGLLIPAQVSKEKPNVYNFNKKFYCFLVCWGISTFPIMIYNNQEYSSILYTFGMLSAACFNIYYSLCKRNQNIDEGKKIESYSFFSGDNVIKKLIPLDYILLICTLLVMGLLFINSYSKTIYPILDGKYGGGKLITIQVITNDGEVIEGPLLHYDDKRYYLLGSNKLETQIIEISKIKTIQKQ